MLRAAGWSSSPHTFERLSPLWPERDGLSLPCALRIAGRGLGDEEGGGGGKGKRMSMGKYLDNGSMKITFL